MGIQYSNDLFTSRATGRIYSPQGLRNRPARIAGNGNITDVLKVAFGFAGGIALIIITLAGLKYALSSGDPQGIKKAKDTILYAIIGLVVSILAFSIVSFTIGNVK